jgi:multiple sugar transport system permease protein
MDNAAQREVARERTHFALARRKDRFQRFGRHALALTVVLACLLPLYWACVASLRTPGLPPPVSVEWWPAAPAWDNYGRIFQLLPMVRYTVNSLFVVLIAVPVTLITASQAGLAMSQLPEQPRRMLVLASIGLLMIPAAAVWLFRFQILQWLGLIDTVWALVAPAFAGSSPLFVLLFYWGCRRIPPETFEAAALDGAGAWTIWLRLALPMSLPTVVVVGVLAFVMYWSDFVSPVLYIYNPDIYTLAVGLQLLKQLDPTNWSLLMAAAVYMTVPVICLFGLAQRYFLHDLTLANLVDGS